MGLARAIGDSFSRFGRYFASLENPAVPLSDPDEWTYESLGGGGLSDAGIRINQRTVLGYPPVWRGINLLANVCKKTPLRVCKRLENDGREIDREHPGYRVIKKPNALMTAGIFRQTVEFHAILHGNGFAYIDRDQRATPRRLLMLDPFFTSMIVECDSDGVYRQVWYITRIGNAFVRLRPEEVLHIRGLSHDGINGFSLLYIMRHALGLGLAARKFGSHFFKNGANQSGILMIPQHFKKEAQENLLRTFARMAQGLSESHKVALLQDGAKFVPTTVAPEQGQFLETRQFEIREVANIIGVPPHKLGDSSRTSYNSLEQENAACLDDAYDPMFVTWEEECNEKLLTEEEKETESRFFEFSRNAVVRMDAQTRAERSNKLVGCGVMTFNEGRIAEGLPTLGTAGDRRCVPSNWAIIDEEGVAPTTIEEGEDRDLAPQDAPKKPHPVFHVTALMLRQEIQAAIKIERREAIAAAKRGGNFIGWVDTFYAEHRDRMINQLVPVAEAHFCASERDGGTAAAETFVKEHCDSHLSSLMAAAEVPAVELVAAVARVVDGWTVSRAMLAFSPRPLFCYGTFCDPGELEKVIGRRPTFACDVLEGFRHDAGDDGYSYLVPDPEAETAGFLTDLTDQELQKCMAWETKYTLQDATLKSGVQACLFEMKKETQNAPAQAAA